MKKIHTQGISYIETVDGNPDWYWGSDYAQGDLYEAEELFRDGHPVTCNLLVFVHYPDGRAVEPVKRKDGQYFGRPTYYEGKLHILLVDFPEGLIKIIQYDDERKQTALVAAVPLGEVKDCYNLLLAHTPLMLYRQGNDGMFQEVWPEKVEFPIGETESFLVRDGDILYFSRWTEPDGQEEMVVRKYPGGEILQVVPGTLKEMPDGQRWLLQ